MKHFFKKHTPARADFPYLKPAELYFDGACQTLRPQPVLDAMMKYYTQYNACGGRVKYGWGQRVDEEVQRVREQAVRFLGKSPKEYTAVFTLNTTYGINLLLQQLNGSQYSAVHTLDREHNSVMLPAMEWAKQWKKEHIRHALIEQAGSMVCDVDKTTLTEKPLVLMQAMSNIDGATARNIKEVAAQVVRSEGTMIIDGAQIFGHDPRLLADVDFDACVGSVHKMYGPSLGVIVLKRSLLSMLIPTIVGGGMVQDVTDTISYVGDEHLLEPGLQDWAGIVGFGAAMTWLESHKKECHNEISFGKELFAFLETHDRFQLVNELPSSTISFYMDGVDSHKLALILGEQGIMVRSGYFCCHRYLIHDKQLPPLLRVSYGMHNTAEENQKLIETLQLLSTRL